MNSSLPMDKVLYQSISNLLGLFHPKIVATSKIFSKRRAVLWCKVMYILAFQRLFVTDTYSPSCQSQFYSDHCSVISLNFFHIKMSRITIEQSAFLASNLESSPIWCEVMYIFAFTYVKMLLSAEIFGNIWHKCVLAFQIMSWRSFSVAYQATEINI